MKKITKTLLAGIVGVATALSGCTQAQPQQPTVKNIVLVHGAFADGTSWAKVIPILEARGFHVTAVQNPLTSLSGDVDATVGLSLRKTVQSSSLVIPGEVL